MKCQIFFASTGTQSNNIILSEEPGELMYFRSNSAAKYRKEDFFALQENVFVLRGTFGGVGTSFATDLLGDLG